MTFNKLDDFFKKILNSLFGRGDSKEKVVSSAKTARERLHIILAHDRTDISPELLETLRFEMIKVLKKYMEIDEARIEIDIEDGGMALAVNIPVIQVKRGSSLNLKRSKHDGNRANHP
ncbi:MAG: cell division topological specificity factor MinE [Synergistaceae bacterium]|nr:cell division topological specificity factor MinE [Synergistaceae bacterium]